MTHLHHVGVLGMKWGRRKARGSSGSDDHTRSSQLKRKKLKDMSNKEIQDYVSRVNLENQYKNLNPKGIAKGAKITKGILSGIGAITTAAGTIGAAVVLGKKVYTMAKNNPKINELLLKKAVGG